MVSYFVPRGRYLLKAGNVRKALQDPRLQQQKHVQQHQQQSGGNLPMMRHFRQLPPNAVSQTNVTSNAAKFRPPTQPSNQQQLQLRRNTFFKWTGFLLRWAPIGLCVFGAIDWQFHKLRYVSQENPRTATGFQTMVYCSLPLRLISRCWGWLASCYMPPTLRPYIYGWYSNMFGVNIEEALYPDLGHYNSLAEFFTRPLKEGARVVDPQAALVSPADGKVLHFGSATHTGLIEQVKGVDYSIEDFLGPQQSGTNQSSKDTMAYVKALKQKRDNSTELYQCVIYLAPGDYHRFHSPAAWHPTVRRHFSGELLSVNPSVAGWLPNLFCLNERVLYMGNWLYGFFSYTAVGATNVGSVEVYRDPELKTNRWTGVQVGAHAVGSYDELQLDTKQDEPQDYAKGDLIGQFNMGSTIVLLFEAPKNFQFDIVPGQKISMGQSLGHMAN